MDRGLLDPNKKLALGFTPEGWFQLQAEGLFDAARLPEGRFPNWRDAMPPAAPFRAKVGPEMLRKEVKALGRSTTAEDRSLRITLCGSTLTLAVENAQARSAASVVVQDLSDDPSQAATADIDPRYLLPYLDAQKAAFVVCFSSSPESPLRFEGEGYHFLLMPIRGG